MLTLPTEIKIQPIEADKGSSGGGIGPLKSGGPVSADKAGDQPMEGTKEERRKKAEEMNK